MKQRLITDNFLESVREIVQKRRVEQSQKFSLLDSKIVMLSNAISSALPMIAGQINCEYIISDREDTATEAFTGRGKIALELKNFMTMGRLINQNPTDLFDEEFKGLFIRDLEEINLGGCRPNLLSTARLIEMFADSEDQIIEIDNSNNPIGGFGVPDFDIYGKAVGLYRVARKRFSWRPNKDKDLINGARMLIVPFVVQEIETIFFIYTEPQFKSNSKVGIEGFQYNPGEGAWYRIENEAVVGTSQQLWQTVESYFLEAIQDNHIEDGWEHIQSSEFSYASLRYKDCGDLVHHRIIEYFNDNELLEKVAHAPDEMKRFISLKVNKYGNDGPGEYVHKTLTIHLQGEPENNFLRMHFCDNRQIEESASSFYVEAPSVYGDRHFSFTLDKMPRMTRDLPDAMFFIYFFACELRAVKEFERIISEMKASEAIEKPSDNS